jgi:hypothetical protein
MGHEVYPGSGHGPYVQQVCARGAVFQGTVVLIEGATSEAGEEGKPPSPYELIEASANIVSESWWASCCVFVCQPSLVARGPSPRFIDQGETTYSCVAWL